MKDSINDSTIVVESPEQRWQGTSDSSRSTSSICKKKTNKKKGRHGARNQHRHKLMVKWIANKFPDSFKDAKESMLKDDAGESDSALDSNLEPRHRQQQHILDVAGGKGELSARLTFCHTLHVRMVDPRPANVLEVFHKTVFRSLPKKWQQKISAQDPCVLEEALRRRFHQLEQCFPSDGRADLVMVELKKDDFLRQTVEQASLLIGMHADGATEAIVDVALHYRKPFVVVPCCVFPNFFKHRFVPSIESANMEVDMKEEEDENAQSDVDDDDDKFEISKDDEIKMVPVRSHAQFCQYLALKDSHIVVETLPFEGRNIAIWWDGVCRDGDGDK